LVLMSGFVLMLRAVFDYNVLQSARVAVWSVAIAAALSFATFLGDPAVRRKPGNSIGVVVIIGVYAYGSTIEINGMYVRSAPVTYFAVVQGKRIDRGKHTSYELELAPWGPKTKENDLEVRKTTYAAIQPGDLALMTVRTGLLGVKWYQLRSWDHVPSAGVTGGK
jgi:hypothetical protein